MASNSSNTSIVSADDSITVYFCGEIPPKHFTTKIDTDLTCEKVIEMCINYIQNIVCVPDKNGQIYGPKYFPAFGLVIYPEDITWIPLNHVFKKNTEKARTYKFRVRFRPPADQFHDTFMCEYLIIQLLDDFLKGPVGKDPGLETKTLFGLLQVALMIPTTLPLISQTPVDKKFKCRNFKIWDFTRLISKEVAKKFISQPLVDHYWVYVTIKEKINDFKRHNPPAPLGFYKKKLYKLLMEAVPSYCFEQYRVTTVSDTGTGTSTVKLRLYKESGVLEGLYYGEQYQCSLKDIHHIELKKPTDLTNKIWQVNVETFKGLPKILQFEEKEMAESFMTMIMGYYKLLVRYDYDNCLCRELLTTGAKISADLKSFGPIGPHTAESYLEESKSETDFNVGVFLIHDSSTNFSQYEIVCWFKTNHGESQTNNMDSKKHLLSGTIEYLNATELRLKIDGKEKTFGNCDELRRHLANEFGQQVYPRKYSRVADINDDFQVEVIECYEDPAGNESFQSASSTPLPVIKSDLSYEKRIPDKNPLVAKYEVFLKTDKMMLVDLQSEDGAYAKAFREGLETLLKLNRINDMKFLKFHNMVLDAQFSVLMEYVPEQDVLTYVCNNKPSVAQMLHIMQQIVEILLIMDNAKIFHGNLRLRKFMTFPTKNPGFVHIKLGDPGISSFHDTLPLQHDDNIERTPWLSPERRQNLKKITSGSEVYAVGTTLYELLNRNDQFHELLNLGTDQNIQTYLEVNKHLPQPAFLSESSEDSLIDDPEGQSFVPKAKSVLNKVWKICLKCWSEDEEERPTVSFLHNDIKEVQDEAVLIQEDTIFEAIQSVAYDMGILKQDLKKVPGNEQKRMANLENIFQNKLKAKYLPTDCIKMENREELGSGHYGAVWKGLIRAPETDLAQKHKSVTWKEVAVKRIKKTSGSDRANVYKEVILACELDHPNIVKLLYLSVSIDKMSINASYDSVMLIMEYMNEGNLSNFSQKLGNLKTPELVSKMLKILLDVAEGMAYLAGRDMVHRDLAARNVLLNSGEYEIIAKVSDFGLARMTDNNYRFYKGQASEELPFIWMAPENLVYDGPEGKFTTLGDVWSFGIVVWEAFSNGITPKTVLSKQLNRKNNKELNGLVLLQMYKDGFELPKSAFMNDAVYNLMKECCNMNQNERPHFVQLVQKLKHLLPQK